MKMKTSWGSTASYFKPDVTFSPKAAGHRIHSSPTGRGDLYFIANTSNRPQSQRSSSAKAAKYAEWWDPFTGRVSPVENAANIEVCAAAVRIEADIFYKSHQ